MPIRKTSVRAMWSLIMLGLVATFAAAADQTGAISQAASQWNGKIAFVSDRDGNREIYVMKADGTSQTRLTNNNIIDDHPKWSPDGKTIAFLSQDPSGSFAIFRMNADGTNKTEITRVAYDPGQSESDHAFSLSWSPDGRYIAFSEYIGNAGVLSIVRVNSGDRRTLRSGVHPAWSPDGSKILFLLYAGSGTGYQVYTVRPNGSDLQNIPLVLPDPEWLRVSGSPSWSPDGSSIAFEVTDFITTGGICIANADGSNAHLFGDELDGSLAWSPNGKKVTYASWDWGKGSEVFVRDIDGGVPTRLTFSGSNSNPDWQSLPDPIALEGGRLIPALFLP